LFSDNVLIKSNFRAFPLSVNDNSLWRASWLSILMLIKSNDFNSFKHRVIRVAVIDKVLRISTILMVSEAQATYQRTARLIKSMLPTYLWRIFPCWMEANEKSPSEEMKSKLVFPNPTILVTDFIDIEESPNSIYVKITYFFITVNVWDCETIK